jgi:hypothetical protein
MALREPLKSRLPRDARAAAAATNNPNPPNSHTTSATRATRPNPDLTSPTCAIAVNRKHTHAVHPEPRNRNPEPPTAIITTTAQNTTTMASENELHLSTSRGSDTSETLSPLEQEVLDEYARLLGNLNDVRCAPPCPVLSCL